MCMLFLYLNFKWFTYHEFMFICNTVNSWYLKHEVHPNPNYWYLKVNFLVPENLHWAISGLRYKKELKCRWNRVCAFLWCKGYFEISEFELSRVDCNFHGLSSLPWRNQPNLWSWRCGYRRWDNWCGTGYFPRTSAQPAGSPHLGRTQGDRRCHPVDYKIIINKKINKEKISTKWINTK